MPCSEADGNLIWTGQEGEEGQNVEEGGIRGEGEIEGQVDRGGRYFKRYGDHHDEYEWAG